ncbi:MobA-like NTP transferase domain-containing protein [Roseomonas rosea]|uniref:MobA-like NTP transferase domain-containing protein n=1 Tax=Muricoccus roseus TaxID=198092 RepID=A0A1M6GCC4_9PROT|nr:nucleotidyltransferase family protein [Roseomonas rosea]SHJ07605.1 MobA-like NTP transferase domain-containing protein [Roseomonas rosea]
MIRPTHGMVLAAGLGTRMRPLTEAAPKPLLALRGRSLLDHALDRLADSGMREVVVNAHHLAPQIVAACEGRTEPRCQVVVEPELLETGGGIRNALPLLGPAPFAVVNGDAYWLDGPVPALRRLAAAFDEERMDGLLLMARSATVEGEVGLGDFLLDPLGRLRRPKEREIAPYIYAGVQILHPRLLDGTQAGRFGLMGPWMRAIEAGRLYGLVHDGAWFHLSTPPDLQRAEEILDKGLVKLF